MRAALSLWRGEVLTDFTFEPFAQAPIARLTELRLTALEIVSVPTSHSASTVRSRASSPSWSGNIRSASASVDS